MATTAAAAATHGVLRHLDRLLSDAEADAATCPAHLPFFDYMDACMFDPAAGYYASGRVDFGHGADYWTFPSRLSPYFGALLAERVWALWELAPGSPFHVVEIGGGTGQLLLDVAAALEARPGADALIDALRLVSVDRSAALLESQQQTQRGLRVSYLNRDASDLAGAFPRPFRGLVIANELLDQLSAEAYRLDADGAARRVSVLPWLAAPLHDLCGPAHPLFDDDLRPLRADALPALLARLAADAELAEGVASRALVRWTGTLGTPRDAERDYLTHIAPEIAHLAALGLLPSETVSIPGVAPFIAGLGALFADGGAGGVVLIDYGGTTRHLLDVRCRNPHVRTHGEGSDHDPFRAPGAEDITTDVDFGWVAAQLAANGLDLAWYGHQGDLEADVDLWTPERRAHLIAGRSREGHGPAQAALAAWELVRSFRHGGGFLGIAATTAGLGDAFARLGDGLPLDGLRDVPVDLDRAGLSGRVAARLVADGMVAPRAAEIAERGVAALHPGGSVMEDLMDAGAFQWRRAFLAEMP